MAKTHSIRIEYPLDGHKNETRVLLNGRLLDVVDYRVSQEAAHGRVTEITVELSVPLTFYISKGPIGHESERVFAQEFEGYSLDLDHLVLTADGERNG